MAIAWPSYFPIALRAGYGVQAADVVARTPMEGGPQRLRQIAPPGPEQIPVSWIMSSAVLQMFRAYWIYDLASGSALVDLPLLTDGALAMQTINFVGAYRQELVGAKTWRVSATVETRRPKVLSASDYQGLAEAGGPDGFTAAEDQLNTTVNVDLPESIGA